MEKRGTAADPKLLGGAELLVLVLVNAVWGSTDSVAKHALESMTPAMVAWARFTVALLVLSPALYSRRAELPRTLRGLLPYIALGASGFFLNFVIQYHGIRLSLASHATALRVSEVLAIMALSVIFLREKVGARALAGMLIGSLGVAMVLKVDFTDLSLFGEGHRLGDILIMAGIVVEGLYTIVGKKVLARTRPLTATAMACLLGWLMLTAYAAPEIAAAAAKPPPLSAIVSCVYLGVFATALCYWVWYRILARRDSHRVGATIMTQPLVGLPLAAILFGDELDAIFLAGSALIALGVILATGSGRGPKP